jgi:hypothetical protein
MQEQRDMNINDFWRNHGTKLIGFLSTAIGALEFLDSTTLRVIERALGPQWGPRVSNGVLILAGLATAYRGFLNSARTPDVLPAPQPRTPTGTGS